MKKLIAMLMTIALLLGLLTIPAAAITPGSLFDPDKAAEHNKNAVKAAAIAAENGELPGNVTVIVDDEECSTEEDKVEVTEKSENNEKVSEELTNNSEEDAAETNYPSAKEYTQLNMTDFLSKWQNWLNR